MSTPRPETRRRDYRPGPLRSVSVEPNGRSWTLTFARKFPQSRASLWSALTEPNEHLEWAPYMANRSLCTVGPATLIMTDGDSSSELDGTVTFADEPSLLEHAWGEDLLRWRLDESSGGGTLLTLQQTVENKGTAAMLAAGWHMCLDVAERALSGDPVGRIVGAEAIEYGWRELNAQYAAILDTEPLDPPVE